MANPPSRLLILYITTVSGLILLGVCAWALQTAHPWLSDSLLAATAALIVVLIRTLPGRRTKAGPPPLVLERVQPRTGFTEDVVLHVAASLDRDSDHPVARAIVHEAKRRGLPVKIAEEFRHHEGFGVTGKVDGRIIAMGSHRLMTELGVDFNVNRSILTEMERHGAIVVFISINSYYAGLIVVRTPVTEK